MTHNPAVDHDFDLNPPPDEHHGVDDSLAFSRAPLQLEVKTEQIRACSTVKEAMRLAIAASGLDDAEIYQVIGVNQGYFSKIRTGEATLKADKEVAFCKRVGNMVYPEWRAFQHGCTLVEISRFAALLQAENENAALRAELDSLRDLIRGKIADTKEQR